jgi:preprotein translocase subunit SecE
LSGAAPRGPAPPIFLAGRVASNGGGSAPTEPGVMATNPFEFLQQVRSEASKVVWPTRRETMVTTGMVMLLVVFASLFLLVVDELLRIAVALALGIGRGG